MDFYGTMFLSSLPMAREEMLMVEGKEERCLVIPMSRGQLIRGKNGEWCMNFRCTACEPDADKHTHRLSLAYRNKEKHQRSVREGTYPRSTRLGHLFVKNEDRNKKEERTNNMTPILCTGSIVLDDIKPEHITQDPYTGKRYVRFTFRKTQYLDAFGNSHEIVCVTDCGEQQIGLAKEWQVAREQMQRIGAFVEQTNPQQQTQDNTHNTTPSTIDGYVF